MAVSTHTILRQRFCKASDCRTLFFICSHCDRGQRYCSSVCRRISRLEQQRTARRRFQHSSEGRLDHRDRQRAYRLRKAAIARALLNESVTEHGSPTGGTSVTIWSACSWLPEPVRPPWWNLACQMAIEFRLAILSFLREAGALCKRFLRTDVRANLPTGPLFPA